MAENNVGYQNLIQLSSKAYMEGYHYKPRADWELMEQYAEGIIATSGCLGGHVLQSLMQGQHDAALEHAARFQDIFGRDNFFIELQDQGIPEQRTTNPQLLEIARKINAPILATNDSHYTHQHDAEAHDALLCCADRITAQRYRSFQVPRRRPLHQDRWRDAPTVRRGSRSVRQHAVDRRAL